MAHCSLDSNGNLWLLAISHDEHMIGFGRKDVSDKQPNFFSNETISYET